MRSVQLLAATALAIALSVTSAAAQKKYDIGATDTEIKIGQTVPFSGPASAYAGIGKTQAAYMKMINDQGGINGRKLNLIQYDDAYSPPKAVEQVRKLVEGDEVLFTFQIIGTPSNAAVQKYLNARKVPQLLASTGASRFSDPQNAPWTIAFNPNYQSEGRIYAKYILANHPNAKIGIFYQNDDLGRDYIAGLKSGLGDKAASMIVAEVSYELTDPTVDSQIVKLKAASVDLLYDASTPKFAAQAIRNAGKIDDVKVFASGEGSQLDCDQVTSGNFSKFLSYKATEQGHDLMFAAETLLMSGDKPGTKNLSYYTRPIWIDKSNASLGGTCFALPKKN